ncbi:kinase-like protein [Thelephora ganbajun]|uniref:Kinase-like protein n=1 Tax=Thelephora ganbajun TaxID=370292 RepID=A0ACB6Z4S5_THEGA|nr:kinase-like protein [Thelephora ganbajun]
MPFTRGGFGDVYRGTLNGSSVCVKRVQVYTQVTSNNALGVSHQRQAVMWKRLDHPNILLLQGVTISPSSLQLISAWMPNGNLLDYIKKNSSADRLALVSLSEVAEGLSYLHSRNVIHGDLKGDNIVIDRDGHARLADFSLITLIPDQSTFMSSCMEGGALPWMSPELLDPESFGLKERHPTKESDCYALGMVIYEVLSGQAPFATYSSFAIVAKVLRDERPERPQGERGGLFTDGIWEVVVHCWRREPSDRASARDVLLHLGGTLPPLRPSSPNIYGDPETDSDDQSDFALSDF